MSSKLMIVYLYNQNKDQIEKSEKQKLCHSTWKVQIYFDFFRIWQSGKMRKPKK